LVDEGRVDLSRFRFERFVADFPLAGLRALQESLTLQVQITPLADPVRRIGGVDVSYMDGEQGAAALTVCDSTSAELLGSTRVIRSVRFPYISSFLAFRELPLFLAAIDAARERGELPDVLLVDGSGIMHPRRAGIASHLGVVTGLPTIGVTKTKLIGRLAPGPLKAGESSLVTLSDEAIGAALGVRSKSCRPIYVSPGHLCDVDTSIEVVRGMLRGHRLPEPLYWADRVSREAARRLKG
jgi:deoxyribonuclease V